MFKKLLNHELLENKIKDLYNESNKKILPHRPNFKNQFFDYYNRKVGEDIIGDIFYQISRLSKISKR